MKDSPRKDSTFFGVLRATPITPRLMEALHKQWMRVAYDGSCSVLVNSDDRVLCVYAPLFGTHEVTVPR